MHTPAHRRRYVIALVACLLTGTAASYAHAATCPGGTVPIGSSRAEATAAGIPQSAECWDPKNKYAGQDAGSAKAWLQQHATQNAQISCLNAEFAENVKKLMQANPNGIPTIRDGYRSPQAQANLPAGSTKVGPCGSYHQYGMAADFDANQQSLRWMRENASQYGLSPVTNANPTTGCTGSGFCDAGHIQIAGARPPVNQCGVCSAAGGNGMLPASPGGGVGGGMPGGMGGGGMGSGMGGGGMSGSMPQSGQQGAGAQQTPYPDDFRPYTPNQAGVCDPGFTYIGTQCQPTNFDCPPGYHRAIRTASTTNTGVLAAACEADTTPAASSTPSTPQNPASFLHTPQGWPLRAEVTGYIVGNTPASIQPLSQLYAQPHDSPAMSWSTNPQRQIPSFFADVPATQPNAPAYQTDLSGHAGGLADDRLAGTPAQDPSLTIAPARGSGDTFASGPEQRVFVSPPATRGWFGSLFDRMRSWFDGR